MKNHSLLFSFSFAAVSLAALGGGAYAVKDLNSHIRPENFTSTLKVEVPTPIPPVKVEEPQIITVPVTVIEAPRFKAPVRQLPKSAIALQPKEKEMVCSGGWLDSNYGGQYRTCEMK